MEDIIEYGIDFTIDNKAYKSVRKFEKRLLQMQKKIKAAADVTLKAQMPQARKTRGRDPATDQQKQEKRFDKIAASFNRRMFVEEHISDEKKKQWRLEQKQVRSEEHLRQLLVLQQKEARKLTQEYRKQVRINKQQNFLQRRMAASSREFAGNMVSAFAAAGAGVFITQTGQQFQALENTMLAVSEGSEQAGERINFVREQANRLGVSFTQVGQDYAKLLAGAQGQISESDTQELLKGILETSTVLGLSADDTNGSLRAVSQMLSKTKVTAKPLALWLVIIIEKSL